MAVRENRLTNPARVTPADIAWFIDNPGIWLWEDQGEVLGFAAADTRDGSVWALFVAPGHDGKGIGRALLAHVLEILRAAGFTRATLGTGQGTRAEGFYRRAGWQSTGAMKGGDVELWLAL